jgi:hypothetical protein
MPMVGIADRAVVDGYQEFIDLARTHHGVFPCRLCSVVAFTLPSEILRCEVKSKERLELGHLPSVYRVGLSQLLKAGAHHVLPRDGS